VKKITSKFLSIDGQDCLKGLVVAAGGSVLAVIEKTIEAGSLTFDWETIGRTALLAGLSYLGKQLLTPAKIVTPAEVK
jgi:hypothetical protein